MRKSTDSIEFTLADALFEVGLVGPGHGTGMTDQPDSRPRGDDSYTFLCHPILEQRDQTSAILAARGLLVSGRYAISADLH
jgi:hypothetical protein